MDVPCIKACKEFHNAMLLGFHRDRIVYWGFLVGSDWDLSFRYIK